MGAKPVEVVVPSAPPRLNASALTALLTILLEATPSGRGSPAPVGDCVAAVETKHADDDALSKVERERLAS
jgi:hypothetical protein